MISSCYLRPSHRLLLHNTGYGTAWNASCNIRCWSCRIACSLFRNTAGAAQVFVIDYIPSRLDLVKIIGALPINFTMSDPVAVVEALRAQFSTVDKLLSGEKKMQQIMSGIENIAKSEGVDFNLIKPIRQP